MQNPHPHLLHNCIIVTVFKAFSPMHSCQKIYRPLFIFSMSFYVWSHITDWVIGGCVGAHCVVILIFLHLRVSHQSVFSPVCGHIDGTTPAYFSPVCFHQCVFLYASVWSYWCYYCSSSAPHSGSLCVPTPDPLNTSLHETSANNTAILCTLGRILPEPMCTLVDIRLHLITFHNSGY